MLFSKAGLTFDSRGATFLKVVTFYYAILLWDVLVHDFSVVMPWLVNFKQYH
jgi:hypothetical protein